MSWEILIPHISNVVSILVVLVDSLSENKEQLIPWWRRNLLIFWYGFSLIFHFLHWRDSSVVTKTCCSCLYKNWPGLNSQHPPGGFQQSTTLGPGFWPVWTPGTNMVHRDIHPGKTLMHVKWNKWIFQYSKIFHLFVYT